MINFENATIELNLDYGFVWAENSEGRTLFQACLEEEEGEFVSSINSKDSGWNWGECGDVNGNATDEDLRNFLELAKQYTLKVN